MESRNAQTVVNNLHSDPDGDLIDNIIVGGRLFWILENVAKSSFFDDLENETTPISAASFCDKYTYNADVTERFLNLMVATKFVSKTKIDGVWKYANAPSTSKYLTKASPTDRSMSFLMEKRMVEMSMAKLPTILKTGSMASEPEFFSGFSNKPSCKLDDDNHNLSNLNCTIRDKANINEMKRPLTDHTRNSCETSTGASDCTPQSFTKMMDIMIYSLQHAIPRAFDLSDHRQAVDLGGGSGLTAKLLIDHYPQLSVKVFELPQMANMAKSVYNHYQRMSFMGGDFFKDDLPPADLFILGHVLHSWAESEIHTLLHKIFMSLPPGGELLILEKMLDENKDGSIVSLTMDIMMALLCQGRERTVHEYRQILEEQGFVNTRFSFIEGSNIYDAILTTKPTSWVN